MTKEIKALWALALLASSFTVQAHSPGDSVGFVTGLLHPVLGIDHLLAMLAVGMLSTRLGQKAIWQVPLIFVSVMLFAALWGMAGMHLPSVERGIAASVLALGASIYFSNKLGIVEAGLLVAFFALFHGYAHGREMPDLANASVYAIGFLLGTTGLHLFGIGLSRVFDRSQYSVQAHRLLAGLFMLLGVGLIVQLLA